MLLCYLYMNTNRHHNPLISVILPCYNASDTIVQSVKSVLNQTYTHLQLIVVDDGSTDNSYSLVTSINDKRLVVYRQINAGISSALNLGISYAKGEYIARIDSDDLCSVDRFEVQLNYMITHPHYDIISCDYFRFSQYDDKQVEKYVHHPASNELIQLSLLNSCLLAHPGILAKRWVFKTFQYSSLYKAEDLELWRRLAPYASFGNVNQPLLYYRAGKYSTSKRNLLAIRKEKYNNALCYAYYNRYKLASIPFSDVVNSSFLRSLHSKRLLYLLSLFCIKLFAYLTSQNRNSSH